MHALIKIILAEPTTPVDESADETAQQAKEVAQTPTEEQDDKWGEASRLEVRFN